MLRLLLLLLVLFRYYDCCSCCSVAIFTAFSDAAAANVYAAVAVVVSVCIVNTLVHRTISIDPNESNLSIRLFLMTSMSADFVVCRYISGRKRGMMP